VGGDVRGLAELPEETFQTGRTLDADHQQVEVLSGDGVARLDLGEAAQPVGGVVGRAGARLAERLGVTVGRSGSGEFAGLVY
jgi:hypothetical protein